jgi:ABC-2 type transport system ATP-binding protein
MSAHLSSRVPPIRISKLVKEYGSLRAVDQLSLEMRPGEILGLLGPNGAGKTTIISTLVTLEEPMLRPSDRGPRREGLETPFAHWLRLNGFD